MMDTAEPKATQGDSPGLPPELEGAGEGPEPLVVPLFVVLLAFVPALVVFAVAGAFASTARLATTTFNALSCC